MPAIVLAQYFQAKVFTPETVPNAEPEQVKILCNSGNWSAGIICKNPLWIVHNSHHAPTRQESNLMHEFAHIILKHKMVGFDPKTKLPLRRPQDEDEAVYLGGCLQVPRRGLLWAVQKKMTLAQIALHFNASEEMVQFRTNVSGISREHLTFVMSTNTQTQNQAFSGISQKQIWLRNPNLKTLFLLKALICKIYCNKYKYLLQR